MNNIPSYGKQKEPEKGVKRWCTYKSIKNEDGTFSIYASTNDKDRDGEIINASAYTNLDFYLSENPVILAFHDYKSFPIGKAVDGKIIKNKLKLDVLFADTENGREADYLYSNGFMNSFSVGFIPIDWKYEGDVRVYTEVELLEVSAVPVPANRWANIIREAEKDGVPLKNFKSIMEVDESKSTDKSESSEISETEIDEKILNMRRQIIWTK